MSKIIELVRVGIEDVIGGVSVKVNQSQHKQSCPPRAPELPHGAASGGGGFSFCGLD